jgi:thymidylate synthase (FAD)
MIKWAKIESIEHHGVEDTYDIEMEAPHHNFTANGFVVHNSQQSQRYVKASCFDYVIPPSIARHPDLKKEFEETMVCIQTSYNSLLDKFKARGKVGEQANQDARFVLPQAAETKIVVTMNCRQLLHFFRHRCCARAQWEIKRLAAKMLGILRKELPEVFENAGAKCVALGYCPEGETFTCGRYPLKKDALRKKGGRRKKR